MKVSLIVPDSYPDKIKPEIKKVILKRNNTYGYYSLFVGNIKVYQDHYKWAVLDEAKEYYPNAEIIDKTYIK